MRYTKSGLLTGLAALAFAVGVKIVVASR